MRRVWGGCEEGVGGCGEGVGRVWIGRGHTVSHTKSHVVQLDCAVVAVCMHMCTYTYVYTM